MSGSGLRGWLSGLRSWQLFLVAAALFAADLLIPDPIPFVDEVMLALITLLLARWKGRRE